MEIVLVIQINLTTIPCNGSPEKCVQSSSLEGIQTCPFLPTPIYCSPGNQSKGFFHSLIPLPLGFPLYHWHIFPYLSSALYPPLRENRDFLSFKSLGWHPKPVFGALEEKVFMLTTGIGSEELVGRSSRGKGQGFPSHSPLLWCP